MAVNSGLEVVGRDKELARLATFLEQLQRRANAVLIRGEAGIGKTVLWRSALSAGEAAGARVLVTRCVEVEMPIAFGGLSDLFDGTFGEVADDLPEPQRRALAVALGFEEPQRVRIDRLALSRALVVALRLLAERAPVLVAIDDLQWLDGATRRVLAFALRRVADVRVGTLATLRGNKSTDPLALAQSYGPDRFAELELGPLSTGALQHLVRSRLGVRTTRPMLARVQKASGGNPMFAIEFARAVANRSTTELALPLSVPPSLQELVHKRVASFSPEIVPLLDLVATLERPTLSLLSKAHGTAEVAEELLDLAIAEGALVLGEDGVARFAHPLLASSVYGDLPHARRRALHRQVALVVDEPEERARHLALATAEPDAGVAAALDEAAERARTRGAPDTAADLAEQARRLTPSQHTIELAERSLATASYLIEAVEVGRAVALLDGFLAGDVTGPTRARALRLRAVVEQETEAAIGLLESALEHTGEDRALRARILRHLGYGLAFWRGDLVAGEALTRQAVALAEQIGDPAAAGLKVSSLGGIGSLGGIAALLGHAQRDDIDPTRPHEEPGELSAGVAPPQAGLARQRYWAGDLGTARELLEAELNAAVGQGSEQNRWITMLMLAEVELRAGKLALANRYADEALEISLDGDDPWGQSLSLSIKALLATLRGQVDEARRLLARKDEHHVQVLVTTNRWVLGFLELSLAQPLRAWAALGAALEDLERMGVREPGFIPVLPDAVETLVALGRIDEAEAVLERLESDARALEHRWATPAALRCRGLLLLGRGQAEAALDAAEHAVKDFEAVGFPLDHGRALLVAGDALRRLGQRRRAAEKLQAAADIFREVGAVLWLGRAETELRRASPRLRRDRALTNAERAVAALVASGNTNREVAAQLFTTVSTVEAHLTRIYRKVGVRSRSELARRVAAGELVLTDE